jgi:hypothetical protein
MERRLYWRLFTQGAFCGSAFSLFIFFEAPIVAGASVLPVPKYAFAGPGGSGSERRAWNQDKRHSGVSFEIHRVAPSFGDVEKSVRAHSWSNAP